MYKIVLESSAQKAFRIPRDLSLVIIRACSSGSVVRFTKTFNTLRSSDGAKNEMYSPSGESFGLVYLGFPKSTSLGIIRSSDVEDDGESVMVDPTDVRLDDFDDAPPLVFTK